MDIEEQLEEVKRQMRELMQGKASLAEAMGLELEDILALATVARQLAEQGQYEGAQSMLEGLVVLDPQNPFLHSCLGCVYMQMKQNVAAYQAFNIALHFNEKDIAAHAYAGELALEQGLVEEAAMHLRRAAELDPDGKNPHANRARVTALLLSTLAKEVQERGTDALKKIVEEARRVQTAETTLKPTP